MSGGEQRVGDYRVVCDFSGFQAWRSECVKTWQGYIVHRRFVGSEVIRHPQDLVRVVPDDGRVPDARPEGTDVFITSRVLPSDL